MSALCQKRTSTISFDHLVGKRNYRVRHGEIHRFGGFQVEHEQVTRRLFEWQVGWFCALENAVGQRGGTLEGFALVSPVRHQAAIASNEVLFIDRRQPMLGGVINYALTIEES